MPTRVSHRVVEEYLLQAARLPETLYAVVGLVWFSLVNSARDPPAGEVVAAAAADTPGADLETASLASPQVTATWTGYTHDSPSGAPSISEKASAACRRPAIADHAVSTADVDEWANTALSCFVGGADMAFSEPFSAMLPAALQAAATTASSEPESPSSASCVSRRVPVVELSPLILRVLLWWAGRPRLPSRRSGHASMAARHDSNRSHVGRGSVDGEPTSASPADSRANLNPSSSECGGSSDFLSQQHGDAADSNYLRLRIADIFVLLSRRGGGVAVSDALLYGRCHDASELAAQRCDLVLSGFSDARWRAATTLAPTSAARFNNTANLVPIEAPAPLGLERDGSGAGGGAYDVSQVLCALVDLHLSAASATHHSQPGPSPHLRGGANVELDAVATGVLLRALLRCPPLHKRVMRLFSGDARAAKSRRCRREGSAVFVMPPSVASEKSSRELLSSSCPAALLNVAGARRQLSIFLPALTHASPIVSAESWKTLTVLLFPFSVATVSSATRRLLLLTPACPVQRLLAATLALPGDDNDGGPVQQPGSLAPSHPMARNSALRLLHVLCVSTDLPPAVQPLFYQCPALLWRVLRLAASVCKGIPVAHVGLVRRVLTDYIMLSARQPGSCAPGGADLLRHSSVTTQTLLRENKNALARFLASTFALWGGAGGGIASEEAGGDLAGAAPAASESVYDERHLLAALHAL
ncbi:hypothetical protein JIQ42_03392 [Leishmania sp. Namibia]|uniref:hypothetical protein n=1 Tax=Leishmania sp. Namibia TaxID=2802991 RepID=UPI001B681CC6|nr:hypothetical protein JIQ42_03392 [Leishmania sp. Namibia]